MASDPRITNAQLITLDDPVEIFNRKLDKFVKITNMPCLKVNFSDHTYETYQVLTDSKIDRSTLEILQKRLELCENRLVKKTMLIEKYKKHNPTLPERKKLTPFFMNEIQYSISTYESHILKLKIVLKYIEQEIDRNSFMEVIKTPCKPGSALKGLPIVILREIMSRL